MRLKIVRMPFEKEKNHKHGNETGYLQLHNINLFSYFMYNGNQIGYFKLVTN